MSALATARPVRRRGEDDLTPSIAFRFARDNRLAQLAVRHTRLVPQWIGIAQNVSKGCHRYLPSAV